MSTFADDLSDQALSKPILLFSGSFNSDGQIKMNCAQGGPFGHNYLAMGFEWTTKSKEKKKGRIFEWITDSYCSDYIKAWTVGDTVYFQKSEKGSRDNWNETPLSCVESFQWDPKKQKFAVRKSKCKTAAWQLKDNKAKSIFDQIIKKVSLGDFTALRKMKKPDRLFLKTRFRTSTVHFQEDYEPALRAAALKYVENLNLKNTTPEKIFTKRAEINQLFIEITKWFADHCPDLETSSCKYDRTQGNENDDELSEFNEKSKSLLNEPIYGPAWIKATLKIKNGDEIIFGMTLSEVIQRADDLIGQTSPEIQFKHRLKLADRSVGIASDEKVVSYYENFVLAAVQARTCQHIPKNVWKALQNNYDPADQTDPDIAAFEKRIPEELEQTDYETFKQMLYFISIKKAYSNQCESIPKYYFERLALFKKYQ